jgi:signal transduction histidine kinase
VGAAVSAASAEQVESAKPPPKSDGAETLSTTLRQGSLRAAEMVGGGLCLIFVSPENEAKATPQLRAAAGFASPEEARIGAAAVEAMAGDAIETGEVQSGKAEVSLGERGDGGVWVTPITFEERIHGALAVASPVEITEETTAKLTGLVRFLGLHLDHRMLVEMLGSLATRAEETHRAEEEKSDEILKLSEALFAQDIELLRSSEKLGKVEKLKHDFIEKMSRELRTPLNGIIESIISVLAGENENLSDSAKENLRHALDDGTSFLRTLQNILDLWRIKQGELPIESQEVNFREVVEEAIFSVQDTLGDKPVSIEKRITEPLPRIRADLAKLNQILFLLLDNAAKFTPEGTIEIGVEVQEDRLSCEIRDSGIGICSDDQQFIFDEFYQVDALSSNKYRGAGLGLALVRDLLNLLDGEMSLSSEVGRGTAVTFHVPVEVAG